MDTGWRNGSPGTPWSSKRSVKFFTWGGTIQYGIMCWGSAGNSMAKKELGVLMHNQFDMSQGARSARKANGTLGYMKLQGRGSCPFIQHWWDHTCSTVSSSGLFCTRETWMYRRDFNKRTQGWLKDWGITYVKGGWESWDHCA